MKWAVSIDERGFFIRPGNFVYESLHEPDREREVKCRVEEDEAQVCVGQVKDAVHHQHGDHNGKRGQEAGREDEEQPVPSTCDAKSAKSIRAARSEDDRCQGAEQADYDAVEEVVKKCVCFARVWGCEFAIGV